MKHFLLALVVALAILAISEVWPVHMYADGSDPMPLCRPSPSKPCPK